MKSAQRLMTAALAGTILALACWVGAQAFPFMGKPKAKPAADAPAASDAPPATSSAEPQAAEAAPPTPAPGAAKAAFRVKGFRSAAFGMTREQVLEAIGADFKLAPVKVKDTFNPQDRTTTLSVTVEALEPGPGPATISYTLGATRKTLMQIGVVWVKPGDPTIEERVALANDGEILVHYFRGQAWPPGAVHGGAPIGPNALSLFAAQDGGGGAVAVNIQGVAYEQQVGGKTVASSPAKGPAALAVIYVENAANPDVYHLPQGAF